MFARFRNQSEQKVSVVFLQPEARKTTANKKTTNTEKL
jgi:hypothetical protein